MFSLSQIIEYYPQNLQKFKKHILREYLQYKILEIIFNSEFGSRLIFLGGSALRIVYQDPRFSEDLDFDNSGISQKEFTELSRLVKKRLVLEGLDVEIKLVFKDAFRCYIKVSKLLYSENLSDLESEKLVIQIDTAPHNFDFSANLHTLDKFDVYTKIKVAPADLILAQKFFAIFKRKRKIGRDFFDVDFLVSNRGITPNFDYLREKLGIQNSKELKRRLKRELKNVDFKKLARDVEVFLFNFHQRKRVEFFYQNIDKI